MRGELCLLAHEEVIFKGDALNVDFGGRRKFGECGMLMGWLAGRVKLQLWKVTPHLII